MKSDLEERVDAAHTLERLRSELERCHKELESCRLRMGELEQAEALLAGENRLLEMVAQGESLPSILDGICRLVEKISSGSLCSILLLDPKDNRLWHGAAPSLPASYTSAFGGKAIGPRTGPCGRAAYFREPVIVCDIAVDPLGDEYRDLALAHGLQACWSTPILSSESKVLGSFAVLAREPRRPTRQHQRIIAQITHLAAVAIERMLTEAALRESEERFRRMADSIPEVIWFTSLELQKVLYVSPSFERIWGFPVERLYQNPRLWTETIHPEDRERVTSTFSRWIAGEKVNYHDLEYRIVQPNGTIRWIHERGVLSLNEQGKAHLASGISTDITERKHAEQELRRSEAYLAEAQKLSLTGSFGWCVGTGELVWSAETFCIMGVDRATKPTLDLVLTRVHPEDVKVVQETIDRVTREGTDFDFEHRVSMPDGSIKHVHVVARPTRTESGDVEFVGAVMDVTERKCAEAALRRSEAYLAEAQKLSQTGSFCLRVASRELVSSAETVRIGGWEPGTMPSLEQALQRVHPDDRLRVQTMLEKALQEGSLLEFAHRLLLPTGEVRHVHTVANSMRNASGEVEFVGAVMDITDKKKSEDAVRAAKARFEGILEIAEDAIISVDSSQHIVLFNQGAEKVFGYTQSEVAGKSLDLLLPQRFAHAHHGHIKSFAKSPEISRSMGQRREVFGRRKDGHEFPAEASISKLDLGNETVFTVILRDITERKQAAEALRAAAQLARGQTEALSSTLDSLVMESAPDRLVEHVLRTIIGQLDAHSAGVWLRNQASGLIDFEFAFENGRLLTKSDAALAKISPALKIEDVWPWPEIFRTGKPSVLEDILEGPSFPWREHVLAMGVVTILIVPMLVAGQVEGVIGIRFTRRRKFRAEEMELAQALAHQAMLAIQLMRLSRQSRQAAVAAERNRMARDIHDTLAQGFTGVIVQLEAAADATVGGMVKEANEHIALASDLARGSLQEARRSVRALRPQALEEKDLCGALEDLLKKMTTGTDLRTELALEGTPRTLPALWGENLLRIGQEVLTNSLRHASASEFKAHLSFNKDQVRLTLRDNGRGFDPVGKHDGFGLLGIRERVEAMSGQLTIQSGKDEGTTVSIILPSEDNTQPVPSRVPR